MTQAFFKTPYLIQKSYQQRGFRGQDQLASSPKQKLNKPKEVYLLMEGLPQGFNAATVMSSLPFQ